MATYSKYVGSDYETVVSTVVLADDTAQSYTFGENKVVTDLLDNTGKLIVPKSIRNAVASLYESTVFVENALGNSGYVGLPKSDTVLKMPYYLGNRLYKGSDIVGSSLLSKYDVLLNNTSTDTSTGLNSTVVAFLAGESRALDAKAPRVDSRVVSNNDGTKRIDLSFVNSGGDVELLSRLPNPNDPGGPVYVNNLRLPALQDSNPALGGSASDDKTLFLNSGGLYWGETIPEDPGYYGSTGSTVPIFGSETYLNDSPLFFTDARFCPIDLGDVNKGDTFDGESLVGVLERIVYEYLPPSCTLELSNPEQQFLEIGTNAEVFLNYSVTKKTYDTKPTSLKNMMPNQVAPIVTEVSETVRGSAKGMIVLPLERKTTVFEVVASDGATSKSASASVTGIYPYYYGTTSSNTMNTYGLSSMGKNVAPKGTTTLDYYRSGISVGDNLFFVHDSDYGYLTSITDPFGNEVLQNFDVETAVLSSPEGNWMSKLFVVYRLPNYYSVYIGANTQTSLFRFRF